jgi:hypothetical protein
MVRMLIMDSENNEQLARMGKTFFAPTNGVQFIIYKIHN